MSVDSGDGSWKTKKGQNAGEIAKKTWMGKGEGEFGSGVIWLNYLLREEFPFSFGHHPLS